VALHQIAHVRVAHSEKVLHTTDLSCVVCRSVHRIANFSIMVHFSVHCWFESWPGHKTVMIQVFNGFPQCLHTDIRAVPQLGWHNCFLPCLFRFITKYLSYHLTSSSYNPQTIYCLESCFFCCCTTLPVSVPLLGVILQVSSYDLKCHCHGFFCLFCCWTCIHSRGPSFQIIGSKQGQELCGVSKQVSEVLRYHGRAGSFQGCRIWGCL
jgi:hypothetical protein